MGKVILGRSVKRKPGDCSSCTEQKITLATSVEGKGGTKPGKTQQKALKNWDTHRAWEKVG